MGVWHRTGSFEALVASAHQPHRIHPQCIAMMTHVLALHKAMLGGHLQEEFWYYWHMLADATPVRKPRGPASTMQHYFALLG
eukprot:1542389-Amphidinium_carterae.1